jgi:hypothetical protein
MPWKLASILWPAIVAALLPLELAELAERLPRLISRLAALDRVGHARAFNDRSRPRQVDAFRASYASRIRQVVQCC